MSRQVRPGAGLHLLEVDLRWPPETFLRWKLEALAAEGMRITVASRSIADVSGCLPGIELVRLPQRGASQSALVVDALRTVVAAAASPRRLLRMVGGIKRLPRAYRRRYHGIFGLLPLYLPIARARPDIVHFEWNHTAATYQPMFGIWGCPVVMSCHGKHLSVDRHVPGYESFAALLPELLSSAAAVHCVSESQARIVLELGVEAQRVRVIPQGVDTAAFRPPRTPRETRDDQSLRVIAVGWPRWVKGFEWALQALRILLDSGVPASLQIVGAEGGEDVGEPAERERLRHTVSDLGLEEHARLRGGLDTPEVAQAMRESDVLLVPSLEEGLPTVILEAMASGMPIVATDCGGVSEAVTDGQEGLLVPPRDAPGLARALERLWRDPALRVRMGEAGRRSATSRFTLARQQREFLALYTELARERPQNGAPRRRPVDTGMPTAAKPRSAAPRLRILSAGSLDWQQGYEHSVQAIRLLLDSGVDCTYRILGEGEHLQAVAFARHQLGLAAHVELAGACRDLAHELGWADVFLEPAVADTSSRAALESARAHRVPVVMTARHGKPIDSARVVPRRDPGAIARALSEIAADAQLRESGSLR